MIIHTFNTYHFVSCINIILILIYNCYIEDVYLSMELYYICIDFVFQFIVEKYRNKLNQTKSNQMVWLMLMNINEKMWFVLMNSNEDNWQLKCVNNCHACLLT